MITLELAQDLQAAGLRWHPIPGDQFAIPMPDLMDEVFTLSDMTIEAHVFGSEVIFGFNGTTEWALDAVQQEETVWMPREDQLRDLLGGAFVVLSRTSDGFEVAVRNANSQLSTWEHSDAGCAYALALLQLLRHSGGFVGA